MKKRKPKKAGHRKADKRVASVRNHSKKSDPLTEVLDGAVTQAVGEAVDKTIEVIVNLLPDGV